MDVIWQGGSIVKQEIVENGEPSDYRAIKRQLQADIDYRLLGQHMQEVRHSRKMTQAAVAEKMKVGVKYYSAIESGKAKINLYRLIQFICIMGTSADHLLVGCHLDYPPSYACPDDLSEDRKTLIALLDHCSDDTVKTLRIVAEGLLLKEKH